MREIATLSELTDLVGGRKELYLRHSGGPESDTEGTSRDYESGLDLPGLSVVPLKPPQWWSRPVEDWIARQIRKYAHLAEQGDDRYAWILTGSVCDFGPDHEPLISDFSPVAVLSDDLLKEAEDRYHDRFEVGRDSLQ
jgi:Family of unknown function (DUF6098)